MNTIRSIITLRRFEKDEPLILYSYKDADSVSQQMVNQIAELEIFTYDDDSFYDLDKEVTYGSNSFIVDRKPSGTRTFYVNGKDIVSVQEARIDLDQYN